MQDITLCGPMQDITLCGPIQDIKLCGPMQDITLCGPMQDITLCGTMQDITLCGPMQDITLCGPMQDITLCGPMQDITSPKNKEYSITVYVGHEDTSIAPLVFVTNKWRILHTALNVSKDFSKDIVKACVLLHNLVRSKDGYRSEEIYMTQNWKCLTVLHVADQDEVQVM